MAVTNNNANERIGFREIATVFKELAQAITATNHLGATHQAIIAELKITTEALLCVAKAQAEEINKLKSSKRKSDDDSEEDSGNIFFAQENLFVKASVMKKLLAMDSFVPLADLLQTPGLPPKRTKLSQNLTIVEPSKSKIKNANDARACIEAFVTVFREKAADNRELLSGTAAMASYFHSVIKDHENDVNKVTYAWDYAMRVLTSKPARGGNPPGFCNGVPPAVQDRIRIEIARGAASQMANGVDDQKDVRQGQKQPAGRDVSKEICIRFNKVTGCQVRDNPCRRLHVCYYCRKSTHIVADCPQASNEVKARVAALKF